MTRMTKEFSLVLLGSSLLTAGYFLWPDDNLEHRAQQQAAQQAAGRTHHPRHLLFVPIFITTPRYASAPPTTGSISRGGFGATGHGVSGVS